MKTATVRDLRTKFPVLARWIGNGESIEITRNGRPIAKLTPIAETPGKKKKPDIMKRLREIYGDKTVSQKETEAILSYNKGRY